MPARLLTASELAREFGVSPTAIAKARDSGRLTPIDGKFDVAVARIQWEANRKRHPARPSAPEASSDQGGAASSDGDAGAYWEAKTRRERAEAELSEIKAAELRGDLVRRAVVERELASHLVALRESLEVLADRLASLVAAESDALRCRSMLRDEHRQALAQFSALLERTSHAQEAELGIA